MSLAALAASCPHAEPLAVPPWTLGCFHRRCITFATGAEDTATRVIWIQSHGLTADLRLPLHRPSVDHRAGLASCTGEERAELARGEGFIARTAWDGERMSWNTLAAFQPYDKWPEPGRLERVGACLIEWAPSGVYVEDWRLQPGSSGLSVGLELVSETDSHGQEHPRTGGLVIAGDHAILLLGRRGAIPPGPANQGLAREPDLWPAVFDAQVAYGRRGPRGWEVKLAIDPFAQGGLLFTDDAFAPSDEANILIQKNDHPGGEWLARRWKVDTLLAGQTRGAQTPAAPEGLTWLAREADALGLGRE